VPLVDHLHWAHIRSQVQGLLNHLSLQGISLQKLRINALWLIFPLMLSLISYEEEVEAVDAQSGCQAIDYRPAKRLRDVSKGVDQAFFDLPRWIPGNVIVNKVGV